MEKYFPTRFAPSSYTRLKSVLFFNRNSEGNRAVPPSRMRKTIAERASACKTLILRAKAGTLKR